MDDFSAKPGVPNAYGLVGAEANAIAPGKRPLSSMSPSFVESGQGVAVLHCKIDGLDKVIVAVGLFSKGIDFEATDDLPVRLLFLVISPTAAPAEHLQSLAAISRWVKADHHVDRILRERDPQAIYELLEELPDS